MSDNRNPTIMLFSFLFLKNPKQTDNTYIVGALFDHQLQLQR